MPVWNPPLNEPPSASFLLTNSKPYWQVNIALQTPNGYIYGGLMLQPQLNGSGSALLIAGSLPSTQSIGIKIVQNKTDAQYGLPPEWIFTPSSAMSVLSPGNGGAPYYFVGINLGIRRQGYLACNISISRLAQSGGKCQMLFSQDVSYYRQWDFSSRSIPSLVPWQRASGLTPPTPPAGWTYFAPTLFQGGVAYTEYVPFPTGYKQVTPTRYGGGKPVFANNGAPGLGQLFQLRLPTAAQVVSDGFSASTVGQQALQQWTANLATAASLANQWGFVGEIFPMPPWNYLSDYPGIMGPFFQQQAWNSWGGAVVSADALFAGSGGFVGMLTSMSTPFNWQSPPPNPSTGLENGYPPQGIQYNGLLGLDPSYSNGDIFLAPIQAYNAFGVSPPTPFLCDMGVPLGNSGCTLYCLTATAPNGLPS